MVEGASTLWQAFLFGLVGGIVAELLALRGRIEWPHRTQPDEITEGLENAVARYVYDLGVLARMFVGGCAAILVLWALDLEDQGAIALVAGSILAGAAGGSVFEMLRGRLEAALATKDLAQARAAAAQLAAKAEQLAATTERLTAGMGSRGAALEGAVGDLSFDVREGASPPPDLASLDTLVGEVRALSGAVLRETGESTALVVLDLLGAWARIPFEEVGPDSKPIADLWSQSSDNPGLADEHLALLIRSLKDRFRGATLALRPIDLRQGFASTVGGLITYLEPRVRGRS